jgi:hypothetical protein
MRKVSLALLTLAPALVHAEWTLAGHVTSVWSHDGYHFIQRTIASNSCGSPGKFWWPASDSDAKDMLALSLTALVIGKPVSVFDGSASCLNGGELVGYLRLDQ